MLTTRLAEDRGTANFGWLHVATGAVKINEDQHARAGDGLAIEGPETVTITGTSDAEVLLFDMGE